MGAKVSLDEVVNLMAEIDMDGNMKISIEEFVTFFTCGDTQNFQDQGRNKSTYNKI